MLMRDLETLKAQRSGPGPAASTDLQRPSFTPPSLKFVYYFDLEKSKELQRDQARPRNPDAHFKNLDIVMGVPIVSEAEIKERDREARQYQRDFGMPYSGGPGGPLGPRFGQPNYQFDYDWRERARAWFGLVLRTSGSVPPEKRPEYDEWKSDWSIYLDWVFAHKKYDEAAAQLAKLRQGKVSPKKSPGWDDLFD